MSAALTAVAFGDDPGRWPLPSAEGPDELWLRAVGAGGQGRYAAARADLTELIRIAPGGRLHSLALSTGASFLRQLGWHWRAHDLDGRALALAANDSEAGVDALVGLAADALGVGRFVVSSALLERATDLARGTAVGRLDVRLAWVRAELAMARGDGISAVQHARQGVELSAPALPALRRHHLKSLVVLAAALCSAGDLTGARTVADAALAEAQHLGLLPLGWALACLLSDIGSATHSSAAVAEFRDRSAQEVVRRGGRWRIG